MRFKKLFFAIAIVSSTQPVLVAAEENEDILIGEAMRGTFFLKYNDRFGNYVQSNNDGTVTGVVRSIDMKAGIDIYVVDCSTKKFRVNDEEDIKTPIEGTIGQLAVNEICKRVEPPKKVPPPKDFVPISQVQITSRFNTAEVTREALQFEINKCIPQLDVTSKDIRERLKKFPSNDLWEVKHASSANIFLLHQKTAICLQKSSENFTIFSAEAFFNTVNPQGVPPEVTDQWYKKIALLIATKGVAEVAYVLGNGNAFSVRYWSEKSHPSGLFYSGVLKTAEAWEAKHFDTLFFHPKLMSVSITKRAGFNLKPNPLSHRSLTH